MGFRDRRLSVPLTQSQVAKQLGVGRTTISMWEAGKSFPRVEMLSKIALLYSCSVDDLLKKIGQNTQ